jgi:eukaryotic-like serine/threonine-protein kinase
MYQITSVEPRPPSSLRTEIPPSVDRIVKRAMEKELELRYQTWEEFSLELAEAFQTEQPGSPQVAESEKFNTLREMPFFSDFSDAELWEVLRISRWENLSAGTTIIEDGTRGHFFCILATGEVKVTKKKKLLNILRSGECFGEMAYLSKDGKARTADVSSMGRAQIIKIHADDLERASYACRHRFDRAFMAIMAERLNLANTRLTTV